MKRASLSMALAAGCAMALAQTSLAGPWRPGAARPVGWGKVIHMGGFGGFTDSFPVSENFDSYTAGSGFPCAVPLPSCSGVNGFSLWGLAETSSTAVPGPNNGTISTAQAHSPPNSLDIGASAVDIVQTGNVTSGQWRVSVWTYVSSGSTVPSDAAYVIVMNTYNPPTFTNPNWSVQVVLDRVSGMVKNGNTGATSVPLVRDQWALVEVLIDLAADTATVNYNGALAYGPLPYSTALGAGAHAIACLDLFSDDSRGVFYDDVSVAPIVACYPNCDHSTTAPCLNVADFTCFLNRFAAGDTYANCDGSTTAPVLNVADFTCFLNTFATGCGTNC